MDRGRSCAAYVLRAGVILVWSGLLAACSQAPPEPAPVFALPLSKIVGATPISRDPPLTTASPPTRHSATLLSRLAALSPAWLTRTWF
jgi:hypothetical protein